METEQDYDLNPTDWDNATIPQETPSAHAKSQAQKASSKSTYPLADGGQTDGQNGQSAEETRTLLDESLESLAVEGRLLLMSLQQRGLHVS